MMTILYADDDHEDQEVFAEIVRSIDPQIKVITAGDGLKALEILAEGGSPDMIFLDVNMPFLNGYEALAEIRKDQKFKNTRVIIYSTNIYQKTYEEYAHLDAPYLRKPNTITEGIQTLRTIIENQSPNISIT